MDWFFALTEDSTAFREYAEMLKVAVWTAKKFTSLKPHFIYEGGENEFTSWLSNQGVEIVPHRSIFRDALRELGAKKANLHFEAALAGAFSRVELPEIVARRGGAKRVLYTDCDIFFTGEVVPELEANRCEYFAVAPERERNDYVHINTGVMLLNPGRLRESWPALKDYIDRNLEALESEAWDQAAYRRFYRDERGPQWDKLRPELNWKPYWGENPAAKIIHFHGPKPYQRGQIEAVWPELKSYTGAEYEAAVRRWENILHECR